MNNLCTTGSFPRVESVHWRSSGLLGCLLSWRQVTSTCCQRSARCTASCSCWHHMYAFTSSSSRACVSSISCKGAVRKRGRPNMSADGCQQPAWTGQAFSYLMHHPSASSGEHSHDVCANLVPVQHTQNVCLAFQPASQPCTAQLTLQGNHRPWPAWAMLLLLQAIRSDCVAYVGIGIGRETVQGCCARGKSWSNHSVSI